MGKVGAGTGSGFILLRLSLSLLCEMGKVEERKIARAGAAPAQVWGVLTPSALPGVGMLDKGAEAFAARQRGPGSPPACLCSATAGHRQQQGTAVTHVPMALVSFSSLVFGDGHFAPGNCHDGKSCLR